MLTSRSTATNRIRAASLAASGLIAALILNSRDYTITATSYSVVDPYRVRG